MIIGTTLINTRTNNIVSRFTDSLGIHKIESIVSDFNQLVKNKEGVVYTSLYKFIYKYYNDSYFVLVTSPDYLDLKGQRIVVFLINNTTNDVIDQIVTMDNILYGSDTICTNLSLIKKMESQEEKIYKIMMKNKENEQKKVNKELRNYHVCTPSGKSPILNKTEIKSVETKAAKQETKKRFETSQAPVFICLKERLKCEVDTENVLRNCEVNGEMTINIKDDSYRKVEVTVKGLDSTFKFSPKLNKESSREGILSCDKEFPMNKNIALIKWKNTEIKKLPISFTFWPSEIKLDTYQISFEFCAEDDLEDVYINIPITGAKVLSVENGTLTGSNVEWKNTSAPKGFSDTLELQIKCSQVSDIFPIQVYFVSNTIYSKMRVQNVRMAEIKEKEFLNECEIKTILEADDVKLLTE